MVLADIRKVIIRTVCLDAPEAEDWLLLDDLLLSQLGEEGRRKGEVEGSDVPPRDELVEEGTGAIEFLEV